MVFSYLLDKLYRDKEKRPIITEDEIKDVFEEACKKAGKTEVILSSGNIGIAIFRVTKQKNLFDQAAVAMYEIAVNHPFSDGNKRTAILAAELILNKGGYKLRVEKPEQTKNMVVKIARKQKNIKEIKKWIKKHAIKL